MTYYNSSGTDASISSCTFNNCYLDSVTAGTNDYSSFHIYGNSASDTSTTGIYIDFVPNHEQYNNVRWFISEPLTPEQQRAKELETKRMLKAQKTAEQLLKILLPNDKLLELEMKRRIEIIARNGHIYEVLEDGRVNKLLPNGKKQGLCIHPINGPYPVADVILGKVLMLENNPEKFEAIANKTTPFLLAKAN